MSGQRRDAEPAHVNAIPGPVSLVDWIGSNTTLTLPMTLSMTLPTYDLVLRDERPDT